MLRAILIWFAAATLVSAQAPSALFLLRSARGSPGDLELAGDLAGQPAGATRYLRYVDILSLAQESFTVNDDANLPGGTQVSGVSLATMAQLLSAKPDEALVVAICDDQYRTSYPQAYLSAHHPVLALRINGKQRSEWPLSADGESLGPYLITHPFFKPAFRVLSHDDEPQIPYGVVRLEFHSESAVLGAIRPSRKWAADSAVAQGYTIAQQDCFRCHNMGEYGGTKAGRSWPQLARIAHDDETRFRQIIRNPTLVNPAAKMPAHSDYNDATLAALAAYFSTFADSDRDQRRPPK